MLAPELPNVLTFEPNRGYLRELLDTQMDLTTLGAGYVREAHERFEQMQEAVHGGEAPPSDRVMTEHDEMFGREYRVQTEGEHPDPAMREKQGRPECPTRTPRTPATIVPGTMTWFPC